MSARLTAFAPLAGRAPHTLILGTMPGGRSLQLGQYYAHPQNQFWRLMGDLFGASPLLPYQARVGVLKSAGVAVWDVLASCEREGSMDADIRCPAVNDFAAFYRKHPTIGLVVFDSAAAESFYRRLALPGLEHRPVYRRVPSPSPAHARLSYEQKLALWAQALVPPPGPEA